MSPQNPLSIAVIGAGVGGLVTAMILNEAGYKITLYEKSKIIGPESCSFMSGGMLAPWCERADTDPEVLRKGIMALDWWENHFIGFSRNGSLLLSSKHDYSEIARYRTHTSGHEMADQKRISELEPALSHLFDEGLFYPEEGHLDPREALASLAHQLEQASVSIKTGKAVKHSDLKEDLIIDCRGLAAREDLPKLRGVRGEMLRIRSDEVSFSRPIRLLHLRDSIYIVPRKNGEIMVGASSIETDWDGPVTVRTAARYLEACERLHPALGQAEILELGAGVRPAFPDNLPHVSREGRVIYLNGFYRHGWLLSPWAGQEVLKEVQQYTGEKSTKKASQAQPTEIHAIVNGKSQAIPTLLSELLKKLHFQDKIVATALNNQFIPAEKRAETFLKEGDRIEILTPMQGG
ncbi:sulfur carrier protein ThiS [Acetobacteraceae bacterium]|nr:sulfur carrier protein ThiS [Acetobacteraceae bacterium]